MSIIYKLKENSILFDGPVIKKEHYLIELEFNKVIEHAKKEADLIIEKAKEQYEKEKKRGYKEGLEEGKRQMSEHIIEMMGRSVTFFASIEKKIIYIVMDALEKILGEIKEEELVIRIVKNALASAQSEKRVIVRVAAEKVEIVKNKINEIMKNFPVISFIEVVPDPRRKGAGCIIESEIGIVDANLDVQLNAIEEAIKKNF